LGRAVVVSEDFAGEFGERGAVFGERGVSGGGGAVDTSGSAFDDVLLRGE
jgi:hypothetical protein